MSLEPLQQLATEKFGSLTAAELTLLDSLLTGELAECGPSNDDPNKAAEWEEDRTIRSSIIRWLCADKNARALINSPRIAVSRARFKGQLNLYGLSVGFSVIFLSCAIPEGINVADARIPKLDLSGTVCGNFLAWGLTVDGGLLLRYGFRCHGPVLLPGASIRGDLECVQGHFGEPTTLPVPQLKYSLPPNVIFWADRISVGGQLAMRNASAHGIVSLVDANLANGVDCSGAVITVGLIMRDTRTRSMKFTGCTCPYLIADRLELKGSLFLRTGFRAVGSVVLLNSSISGDVDCNASFFGTKEPEDPKIRAKAEKQFGKLPESVLTLNGSSVGGYVLLNEGFEAHGRVSLNGVKIGANLVCTSGKFFNAGKQALSCQFVDVKGAVLCRATFQTDGELNFFGATIAGGLSFSGAEFQGASANGLKLQNAKIGGALQWKNVILRPNTALNLAHLKVGQLEDDEQSWPAPGMLVLDGFSYDAIAGVPLDTHRRKGWLKAHLEYLSRQAPNDFTLQPHRQLADILRKSGYEDNAREVLIDMHKARRKQGGFSKSGWIWSWILQGTIGFGYRSHRTFLWALLFVILGAVLFNAGYRSGHLVFAKPEAKIVSQFNAIGYSVDSFLPIINLHQEEMWVPSGEGAGRWIQFYYWIHICLGWALITLGVAGFTGLVRKE
jgi:hypothetical protein